MSQSFNFGRNVFAVADTGSSSLILPYDIWKFTMQWQIGPLMKGDYSCSINGVCRMKCSQIPSLPVIDLMMNGYWIEVSVDDFVVNLGNNLC